MVKNNGNDNGNEYDKLNWTIDVLFTKTWPAAKSPC